MSGDTPREGSDSDAARAKRRLIAVVADAFVTGLALSGITVILPLYATRNLGMTNAQFARVLSLRMAGITVGVILIGALSDRFGNKRLTIACLVLGGACFGILGFVPLYGFLILIPLASAFLSSSFVNLNYLTQIVDPQRQGRANTLYRSSSTLAGILAPLLVTRWLESAQWLFAGIGGGLALGAVVLRGFPLDEPRQQFAGWSQEFRGLVAQYRRALGQKHLMRFVHISLMMGAAFSSVGTFFAIRLTAELGASAEYYGVLCSLASTLGLVGIFALGAVLDRVRLKPCFLVLTALTVFSTAALGLTNSVMATAVYFTIFTVVSTVAVAPTSMWISRECGIAGMGSAFSVHKVLSAGYSAAGVFAFSLLEPALGISRVFLFSGLAGGLMLIVMTFLRVPPAVLCETMDEVRDSQVRGE